MQKISNNRKSGKWIFIIRANNPLSCTLVVIDSPSCTLGTLQQEQEQETTGINSARRYENVFNPKRKWAELWTKEPLLGVKTVELNVSVKSKLQHAPPPGNPPGHLTFLKIIVQIPPYPGQNAVQMPHTRVHSGDQMPPPRGHFTGTKMTEGRRKRLQLSNKIFTNITKTEKHC